MCINHRKEGVATLRQLCKEDMASVPVRVSNRVWLLSLSIIVKKVWPFTNSERGVASRSLLFLIILS